MTKRANCPLRKIVREFNQEVEYAPGKFLMRMVEELECGHIQRQPEDIYGPMNWQTRRRCIRCGNPR